MSTPADLIVGFALPEGSSLHGDMTAAFALMKIVGDFMSACGGDEHSGTYDVYNIYCECEETYKQVQGRTMEFEFADLAQAESAAKALEKLRSVSVLSVLLGDGDECSTLFEKTFHGECCPPVN